MIFENKPYTVKEVANLFHVSEETVHRWRKEGRFNCWSRIGKNIYIAGTALQALWDSGDPQIMAERIING